MNEVRIERKSLMSNKPFGLEEGSLDFTISRMLSEKNVTTLKKMAKAWKLKGYTKMKKEELEVNLGVVLCEEEKIAEVFCLLDKKKWNLFESISKVECIEVDEKAKAPITFMENLGIVYKFTYEKADYATIPQEVKRAYENAAKTEFNAKRQRISLIDDYANSAMALYGLIKINDFIELFNEQNSDIINFEEAFAVLNIFSDNEAEYCVFKDYIVSRAFEENDFEDAERFASIIYSMPRYVPSRAEFLKYANYDYYEITPQITALKKYLVDKMNIEEFVAQLIVDEIHHLSAVQAKPQEFVDVFNKYKIITKEEQVYELMNLVLEVSNNTRLVGNHGYTQAEIAEMNGEVISKKMPAVSTKVGRNESCICGSGKKYKKCCGA